MENLVAVTLAAPGRSYEKENSHQGQPNPKWNEESFQGLFKEMQRTCEAKKTIDGKDEKWKYSNLYSQTSLLPPLK